MSEQVEELQHISTQEQDYIPEPPAQISPAELDETLAPLSGKGLASIDMLMDVLLQLTVELGRTQMSVRQVLDLQKGSVVELNRIAGDAVDIFVNDHLIAKGEVVVVDDKFGVRILEMVSPTHNNNGE